MLRMFKCDSSDVQIDDYPNDLKVQCGKRECPLPVRFFHHKASLTTTSPQPLNQPSRVGQQPKRQNRFTDITYPVSEAITAGGSKYKNNMSQLITFTISWKHNPDQVCTMHSDLGQILMFFLTVSPAANHRCAACDTGNVVARVSYSTSQVGVDNARLDCATTATHS